MLTNFKFCPICGSPPSPQPHVNLNNPPPQNNYYQSNYYQNAPNFYKSEGTTLVLAIVCGLIIFQGIGQMYVGKIGRGIGVLILGLFLVVIGLATVWFGVGAIFLIGYFILFIWQIFDARKLCREYNDYVSRNGRPPW